MISANELRLGNYVCEYYWCNTKRKYCFDIIKLKKIANTYVVCCKDDAYCYDDIKPIPLTEELLLKCGFELSNENFYYIDGFPTINYNLYDEKKFKFEVDIYIDLELKYLHQLQNLYFALTGEELKIKL